MFYYFCYMIRKIIILKKGDVSTTGIETEQVPCEWTRGVALTATYACSLLLQHSMTTEGS